MKNQISVRIVRRTLTDLSHTFDVVLTERECTECIVLNSQDEVYAIALKKNILHRTVNCVDGGTNY